MIQQTAFSALTAPQANPQAPSQSNELGQEDFLTLLTTQLRNQDPLNPLQNTEFLGQMAQFSTVSGIDRMNASLESLGGGLRDLRIGMASNLVGQSVLVPATEVFPSADGAIRGEIELDDPVDALSVRIIDPDTGAVLHSQDLGAQGPGIATFAWENMPHSALAPRRALQLEVAAQTGEQQSSPSSRAYARVLGAVVGQGNDDIALDVEGYGLLHSLEVDSIR